MSILRDLLLLLMAVGLAQGVAGLWLVRRFARRRPLAAITRPPVTILKPICGPEHLLEAAIASFCTQAYPAFQLVIGAQDPADPALDVARRIKKRFPACDITVVIDPTWHGSNGKIGNLINMLPFARHDILVIADSDLHVRPDYLERVVAELQRPGVGLVTTLGGGEAARPCLAGQLGAAHLSHIFVPNALIGEALGRQDCLGGTMALRRETLARVGGLKMLVDRLADDNVLGQLVRQLGLSVRLANTMPVATVQERNLRALWLHELRWARTIGALEPLSFAGCVVQYPLFWALAAVLLTGAAPWALGALALCWAARAGLVAAIDHALAGQRARPAAATPLWMLPLRDVLSVCEIVASFTNDEVVWRGRTLRSDRGVVARVEPVEALSRG